MRLIDTTSGVSYGAPGFGLRVAADGNIERRDASGETSSTPQETA